MSLRPRYSLLTLLILTALVAGGVMFYRVPRRAIVSDPPTAEEQPHLDDNFINLDFQCTYGSPGFALEWEYEYLRTWSGQQWQSIVGKPRGQSFLVGVNDPQSAWPKQWLFFPKALARKLTYEWKSAGRPPITAEVAELIIKFAKENPRAGYDPIQGMLANLGHEVSDTTIKNILKQHGIEPAPTRLKQTTWNDFIRSHFQSMAACDFFTTEVWTKGGLVTFYVLFIIKLATRRIEIAGITASPNSAWIKQIARNLTDCDDGFLNGTNHLLMDRDTKFTKAEAKKIGVKVKDIYWTLGDHDGFLILEAPDDDTATAAILHLKAMGNVHTTSRCKEELRHLDDEAADLGSRSTSLRLCQCRLWFKERRVGTVCSTNRGVCNQFHDPHS